MFEIGMAKDEVKARLAPIPVYTVANPKNEFVLVAGEVRLACHICEQGFVDVLFVASPQLEFIFIHALGKSYIPYLLNTA